MFWEYSGRKYGPWLLLTYHLVRKRRLTWAHNKCARDVNQNRHSNESEIARVCSGTLPARQDLTWSFSMDFHTLPLFSMHCLKFLLIWFRPFWLDSLLSPSLSTDSFISETVFFKSQEHVLILNFSTFPWQILWICFMIQSLIFPRFYLMQMFLHQFLLDVSLW